MVGGGTFVRAVVFTDVAILRKQPKPNGGDEEPDYRELSGGHWLRATAGPPQF